MRSKNGLSRWGLRSAPSSAGLLPALVALFLVASCGGTDGIKDTGSYPGPTVVRAPSAGIATSAPAAPELPTETSVLPTAAPPAPPGSGAPPGTAALPGTTATDAPAEPGTTAPASTDPPATDPPETTVPPVTLPPGTGTLKQGDTGPEIEALQQRLLQLGYWVGDTMGKFGSGTRHAVTALQKAAGLDRSGKVSADTLAALEQGIRPLARSSEGRVVEVDLTNQVLLLVRDGLVEWIFDTSTGRRGFRTPVGQFEISKEVDRPNVDGAYRPKYFIEREGLSIHGYKSVPTSPFSHGCARVTKAAMDWIWDKGDLSIGTPVWIYKA